MESRSKRPWHLSSRRKNTDDFGGVFISSPACLTVESSEKNLCFQKGNFWEFPIEFGMWFFDLHFFSQHKVFNMTFKKSRKNGICPKEIKSYKIHLSIFVYRFWKLSPWDGNPAQSELRSHFELELGPLMGLRVTQWRRGRDSYSLFLPTKIDNNSVRWKFLDFMYSAFSIRKLLKTVMQLVG